jgi:hypothetical protein
MAVWLEIRCDRMTNRKCYSSVGHGGLMKLVRQTRADVGVALMNLESEAVMKGWKAVRGGMICPACKDG